MTTLPPGPRIPSWIQVLNWAVRPTRFMNACARRFGNQFTIRFPGVLPFVFTSYPQAIREIFALDPNLAMAGRLNQQIFEAVLGRQSLLVLDGAEHAAARRLMLPAFHGERMHFYGSVIGSIARKTIDAWKPGETFSL